MTIVESGCGCSVCVKVTQLCPTLCDPMDCPWNSPCQNTGVGSLSLLQENLPNPGIKPRSSTLQADSLPSEPPGKPQNTEVDSLSLLQGIFPTQESNQGLLHGRWIHQLSCQGSPKGIGLHSEIESENLYVAEAGGAQSNSWD